MKTPMQELIEQMWEIAKYGDSYEVAPCIEAAEAMLEKEKEVMRLADKNGQDRNQYEHDCEYGGAEYWDSEPKSFEEYYNETFNTKEK